MAETSERINNHAGFIWSVADLLRGDYKLLTERRQSLITAAVTGELDVAGAIAEEAS